MARGVMGEPPTETQTFCPGPKAEWPRKVADDGSSTWAPGTLEGGPDGASGSGIWPCPALAIVGLWGVSQWVEALPFS